jgi:Uma2 family endonuclease
MAQSPIKLPTDTWVPATWNDYIQAVADPDYVKAKSYYYDGKLRIEMVPIGNDHASDHTVIILAIHLFAGIMGIDLNGKDNCTYRKAGIRECQPDVSYYIGANADAIPWGTGIIDLDLYPAPNLAIEIANTSLSDDMGAKRLLYEDLGIDEYWVVDVQNAQITAFAITEGGSHRITVSKVLPGLTISLLNEALRRSRQSNHGQVSAWLLAEFQK